VFEPLRNAFDLLMERLHGWVSSRATFTAREGSVDEFYQFWVALGVDSEFATALAELGLCFKGGQLLIEVDRRGDDDLFDRVTGVIMHVWRFRKFSDSRWLTMGESCRTLVGALYLGLADLVAVVRKEPKCSDFYIHGSRDCRVRCGGSPP
jgi:hypothetical protein